MGLRKQIGMMLFLTGLFALGGIVTACSAGDVSSPDVVTTGVIGVEEDENYGNVLMEIGIDDFNELGFSCGDSLDINFSNGYVLSDVPYYDGFYNPAGEPLLLEIDKSELVAAINYGSLWENSGLTNDDTAEITLHQAGKYLDVQNAMKIQYEDDRALYESDDVFANFRSINTGRLKEDILYRSASPCDNKRGRARYSDALMQKAGIDTILDLADSAEKIEGYMRDEDYASPYFTALYERGDVIAVNIQANYLSEDFKTALSDGLRIMSGKEGRCLVNCLEGKDRTGFVCALLESLTGAGYDEMVSDYMISYDNYYGINLQSDPEKYDIILKNNFIPMLKCIAGVKTEEELASADFETGAEAYLMSSGMTEEEIGKLKDRLQK